MVRSYGYVIISNGILITSMLGHETTAKIIGDIAPTYILMISTLVVTILVQTHM